MIGRWRARSQLGRAPETAIGHFRPDSRVVVYDNFCCNRRNFSASRCRLAVSVPPRPGRHPDTHVWPIEPYRRAVSLARPSARTAVPGPAHRALVSRRPALLDGPKPHRSPRWRRRRDSPTSGEPTSHRAFKRGGPTGTTRGGHKKIGVHVKSQAKRIVSRRQDRCTRGSRPNVAERHGPFALGPLPSLMTSRPHSPDGADENSCDYLSTCTATSVTVRQNTSVRTLERAYRTAGLRSAAWPAH
jgi:hypothetical protein